MKFRFHAKTRPGKHLCRDWFCGFTFHTASFFASRYLGVFDHLSKRGMTGLELHLLLCQGERARNSTGTYCLPLGCSLQSQPFSDIILDSSVSNLQGKAAEAPR